jgi:isoleucyl-tRNA synthetase
VTREVTEALDGYELDRAVRPFAGFVDDLSTWYLRRSRERIKDDIDDARHALMTLRAVLRETAILLAPFTPFLAERVYKAVRGERESVHLEVWHTRHVGDIDADVLREMDTVRDIVTWALEIRKRKSIKVRQPLAALYVADDALFVKTPELANMVKDELNVKAIVVDADKAGESVAYDEVMTPTLLCEGQMREFLRAVQDARKVAGMSPEDRAVLSIADKEDVRAIVEEHKDAIVKTALLDEITFVSSLENGIPADLGGGVSVVFVVEKK